MSIVYSVFITVVVSTTMFPIYAFQENEADKVTVRCFVLAISHLLPVIILYGKRVFVVLFQKKKNSKEYIRSKIWTFPDTK